MKSRLFLFNFAAPSRLDDELFINKNVQPPGVIRFHPYEPHLAVADKTGVSIWNFEEGSKLNHFNNGNPKTSRITSLDILNEHDLSLLLTGSGMLVDLNVYVKYRVKHGFHTICLTSSETRLDFFTSERSEDLLGVWDYNYAISVP